MKIGLIKFLKGNSNSKYKIPGCCNYDHHYGGCLFDKTCKIEDGERCEYFEESVLPAAVDINALDQISKLHKEATKSQWKPDKNLQKKGDNVRLCECGKVLGFKKRYCPKCRKKKRRESAKKGMSKMRNR